MAYTVIVQRGGVIASYFWGATMYNSEHETPGGSGSMPEKIII